MWMLLKLLKGFCKLKSAQRNNETGGYANTKDKLFVQYVSGII